MEHSAIRSTFIKLQFIIKIFVLSIFEWPFKTSFTGLEVIKLEFILRLKIKRNDWLFADPCPQAANHCAFF